MENVENAPKGCNLFSLISSYFPMRFDDIFLGICREMAKDLIGFINYNCLN